MKLLEPLLTPLAALRRALAVGALASVVVLGTAACEDAPNMDTEQGEDGDGDGGGDDGDGGGDNDEDGDGDGDGNDGDDGDEDGDDGDDDDN